MNCPWSNPVSRVVIQSKGNHKLGLDKTQGGKQPTLGYNYKWLQPQKRDDDNWLSIVQFLRSFVFYISRIMPYTLECTNNTDSLTCYNLQTRYNYEFISVFPRQHYALPSPKINHKVHGAWCMVRGARCVVHVARCMVWCIVYTQFINKLQLRCNY